MSDAEFLRQIVGHRLGDEDVAAALAGLAPESRERLIRTIQGALESASRVLALTQRMSGAASVPALLDRMAILFREFFDAEHCSIFLHDVQSDELRTLGSTHERMKQVHFATNRGIAGHVFSSGEPLHVSDVRADGRFNPEIDELTGYVTRNIIAAPVSRRIDDRVEAIGVAQVLNRNGGDFAARDLGLLETLVAQAAPLVLNAQLSEEIAQVRSNEGKLLRVTTAISTELELRPLLLKIMETVRDLLDCDKATLFIYDRKSKELWIGASLDASVEGVRFPADRGIAGSVLTSGVTINIQDAYADSRFNQDVDRKTGYRTRSILCMPVVNRKGERIAVIQALNKVGGCFRKLDEERLGAFSAQAAISIQNAQLFDEVVRIKNYNESILQSMSNGVLTVGNEGRIEKFNHAAERALRLQERTEPVVGARVGEFFTGANAWVADTIDKVEKAGKTELAVDVELELPWAAAEGKTPTLSINLAAVPLHDEHEKPMGALVVLEDLTREKRLRSTMSRYMTKELADRLLADGEQALGGKLQKATVLFTDLRNFTGISEQIGPQATVSLLNEHFTMMVDIILARGGLLDKYIGDAIMAVFGVPFAGPDDADHAVTAAVDMLRSLAVFNQERVRAGEAPVRMGIGINSDDVVSGNIGSPKRMDYTVIGDGVNLASRLEGANKPYGTQLLISEFTLADLKRPYRFREVDRIRVKGKARPVGIFEVLDSLDAPGGARDDRGLGRYEAGLELYKRRDWAGAGAAFCEALAEWPQDGVSKLYIERCEHFSAQPPGPDWDGVWTMKDK